MPETPSQTVGPFLSIGLTWPTGYLVVPEGSPGAVRITGTVYDGAGDPVSDGLVETWQADADGRLDDPAFGFGRAATRSDGGYEIVTVKPGAIGDGQAPHVDVSLFARGLLDRVVTRIYFPDEVAANAADPLLAGIPADRATTLVAADAGEGELRFDIHLQGEQETVFLTL
ncbi:protocatechuate 3,4-dioxygenase subunit alpha [Pseudonocardia abyssalis]|jgi:protocatechuate 3,4-dioxygenase alpha subunit|uniref:Protocatechuate 3,4-dioxygenase subunit alpha n=1 Tax=Pseudonocardia abyssalis TaxID=2792008 RepID=A0ABS6UV66_9PSEU|nr:protocatechuate 3,4-dioxygenase subunit alpha [Pseudonocardia abyssalis]MBW0116624.1 protocatechuate 3,4-dioxygenase subunit alpha [Pseudonocardia abyssalis]MBW0136159.1 protocatechuate 3,4-dioxygenase subunit alpha [Pseudonocardia abyssalis]